MIKTGLINIFQNNYDEKVKITESVLIVRY